MNEYEKKIKKNYIELGITIIVTIVSLILYLTVKNEYVVDAMRSVFWLSLYISGIYILSTTILLEEKNNIKNVKNGIIKYAPYMVNKNEFIDECKTGLLHSIVRIDGKIYELEVQLNEKNVKKYDKFICYINDNEIIGLDKFLNFKYDGVHCLNELDKIEFLEYNENDPREYFINRVL